MERTQSLSLEPEAFGTIVDRSAIKNRAGWLESRAAACACADGFVRAAVRIIGSQVQVTASLLWKATVSSSSSSRCARACACRWPCVQHANAPPSSGAHGARRHRPPRWCLNERTRLHISQHRDRSYTTRTTLALNKSQQNMYNQTVTASASTAVSPAAFFFFSAKTQSTNTKSPRSARRSLV